ncbi:MAG: pentapeptide repeat-containing protein, partial [Myxococcales bacterium]
FLAHNWLAVALLVLGAAGLVFMFVTFRAARSGLNPLVIAGGAVLVAVIGWGATSWLLSEANQATSANRPQARVEAIKTGLGIAAATGGVFTLLLAVRRQWHQEITAAETNLDAAEKRITELYTKAVEQLGSDKAPVRLGGLYALERLAQNTEAQRQTIVNVFCAYLRMPADAESSGEQEVRLTVQRLLSDHLHRPAGTRFWSGMRLDLAGAALTDFSLSSCTVASAEFAKARFIGHTSFTRSTFSGGCSFASATFEGSVTFDGATFAGHMTRFSSATFLKPCTFGLLRKTWFEDVMFDGTRFKSDVKGAIHAEILLDLTKQVPVCKLDRNHQGRCES